MFKVVEYLKIYNGVKLIFVILIYDYIMIDWIIVNMEYNFIFVMLFMFGYLSIIFLYFKNCKIL